MKTLLILFLSSLFFNLPAVAQEGMPLRLSVSIPFGGASQPGEQLNDCASCNSSEKSQKPSFLSELGDVLLATAIFSGLDYTFFLWSHHDKEALGYYRAFQLSSQVALSAWLFYQNGGPEQWKEGLKVAAAFNLLWWTFNDDLIYYGLGEISNPGYFSRDSDPNGWAMRHAKWTPYGLAKSAVSGEAWGETPFTRTEIIAQAVIGQLATASLLAVNLWDDSKEEKMRQSLAESIAECRSISQKSSTAAANSNSKHFNLTLPRIPAIEGLRYHPAY